MRVVSMILGLWLAITLNTKATLVKSMPEYKMYFTVPEGFVESSAKSAKSGLLSEFVRSDNDSAGGSTLIHLFPGAAGDFYRADKKNRTFAKEQGWQVEMIQWQGYKLSKIEGVTSYEGMEKAYVGVLVPLVPKNMQFDFWGKAEERERLSKLADQVIASIVSTAGPQDKPLINLTLVRRILEWAFTFGVLAALGYWLVGKFKRPR